MVLGGRSRRTSTSPVPLQPEEILIADLEKGVKLKSPTAVHRYLAIRTDFAITWPRLYFEVNDFDVYSSLLIIRFEAFWTGIKARP